MRAGYDTFEEVQGADPALYNADLAPVTAKGRTWDWKAISALWVGMVVCVPAYLLASGLIAQGMSWDQAVFTVFLGNLIVLVPMLLVGHAGTRYGIPFPVLCRSAFGTLGARIPGLLRGLVGCGWFGIQTWIGGSAIYAILNALTGGGFDGTPLPLLGIDLAQTFCFLAFWALHVAFIYSGTESIKWLEQLAAPFLILICLALLLWAYVQAGGFGPMLSTPSAFAPGGEKEGQFWAVFVPGLTAMVGFWATMALNIPDFTRFARSQKDQIIGQAVGLPIPMGLFAFIGVAVTSATVVIYGEAIWDPVELASRMGGVGVIVALAALVLATLTTNLAANVVAPSYGFSNLAPSVISFRMGGYITALIGVLIFPWKLLETAGDYIFIWLIGYSALLGPIAGILIADYLIYRKARLSTPDLFRNYGIYAASGGWNWAGITALILGALPSVPGFLAAAGVVESVPPTFVTIYGYAWFVGVVIGAVAYLALNPVFNRHNLVHAEARA